MFGHRSDGRKLKTVPPFFRVIPCVMLERNYAQVYFKQDIKLKELDEYIDRKAKEGIKLSYMNIIYAAIVRIIAERPYLNRFAMNGSLYARNQIFFSLAIKKSFADEGQETTIKLPFTGTENIFEIKEKLDKDTYEDLEKTAQVIVDMLNTEAMARVRVAFGTIIKDIKEVSRSYKEAKMALDVGKIFYSDKKVMAYSNLGIGRLIYQLPLPLCKMFIKEIFDDNTPDNFDEETLTTINKFFENNLNVSETSRQLYIHRNTLVYRLDKLQKSTGLDLRVFEDAITFRIALMVVKYMNYLETIEY